MGLSITEELRRTFALATLRREAESAQSPRQWRQLNELKTRCSEARAREEDLYAARYDARVEARRRQLIDMAGTRGRDFKPGFAGADRFSPEGTLNQAQRDVRLAHVRRLQRIDDYEHDTLKASLERFDGENRQRGVARDAFNEAADRRANPDPNANPERHRRRPRER